MQDDGHGEPHDQPKVPIVMRPSQSMNRPQRLFGESFGFLRDFAQFAGRRGVIGVILVVLGALLESIGLVMLVPILAIATEQDSAHGRWLTAVLQILNRLGLQTQFERLAFLLAVFAALMILRAVVISLRDTTLARLQIGFVEDRRKCIAQKLAAARWNIVARLRHARIADLMSGDIQQIGRAAHFLQQCSVSAVMLVSQCILAFALSPLLASFTMLFLVAGAVTLTTALRRARESATYVTNANLSLLNSTIQFLGGLKLAISQNLQTSFVSEFEETLGNLTAQQLRYQRQQTNRHLALGTLSALVSALAVLIGFGILHLPTAVVMTLLLIVARINGPAMQIQQGAQMFLQSLPAYEKVKTLEAELEATNPATTEAPVASLQGDIVFRAVSFRHEDAPELGALRNLNLIIAPGSFVGIAGGSGAGKTTFADLLAGLYPPQKGEIAIGGTPLCRAVLGKWRNEISYVSQDPFLFHDSIRKNLLWGSSQSSDEHLWAALILAGADKFVRRVERGLDTVVGERGVLLSGGERQRIALARAVLRKPRLLILDEATNAIDVANERDILERLMALAPRLTIVMIAHRTESLSSCEHVYNLDGGTFVAQRVDAPKLSSRAPVPRSLPQLPI